MQISDSRNLLQTAPISGSTLSTPVCHCSALLSLGYLGYTFQSQIFVSAVFCLKNSAKIHQVFFFPSRLQLCVIWSTNIIISPVPGTTAWNKARSVSARWVFLCQKTLCKSGNFLWNAERLKSSLRSAESFWWASPVQDWTAEIK